MDWFDKHSGGLQAISTIVLVIVTGWYAYLTWRMASSAKEQLNIARDAIREERRRHLEELTPHCILQVTPHNQLLPGRKSISAATGYDDYLQSSITAQARIVVINEGDTSVIATAKAVQAPDSLHIAISDPIKVDGGQNKAFMLTVTADGRHLARAAQQGDPIVIACIIESTRTRAETTWTVTLPLAELPRHTGNVFTGDSTAFIHESIEVKAGETAFPNADKP